MHFLVCLGGLPQEVIEEIQNRSAARFTEAKNNTPILRAVRQPYGFRQGMSDGYLKELSKRIAKVPAMADVAVVLAYVDYGGSTTRDFVERFFPFSLTGRLKPFYPSAASKDERRSALVQYVDDVECRVAELRARVRVVRDVLSGRNFTPLLLPLRNFRSAILGPQIDGLFRNLSTVPDPRASLNAAAAAILAEHPLQEEFMGKKRKRWFEDDRDLRFHSPGSNRHGMARLQGKGHVPEC